jgi:hypothetical protein
MMQAAEVWECDNFSLIRELDRTRLWALLV